jgi:hypothetical protein
MQAFLGAKEGLSREEVAEQGEDVGSDEIKQMLGGQGLEVVFRQVSETLGNSIREIVLDIRWGPERYREEVRFVQYVTTTGRISAPTGVDGSIRTPENTALPPTLPGGQLNPARNPLRPMGN